MGLRVLTREGEVVDPARNVLVSVPLDRVHAIGISTNQPLIGRSTGVISIQAGDDDWSFEFKNSVSDGMGFIAAFLVHRLVTADDRIFYVRQSSVEAIEFGPHSLPPGNPSR